MGTYRLSNQAEIDLDGIWLHGLKKYGLEQADNYYQAFFDRFEALVENPYRYQAVDDIREGYRRSPCGIDGDDVKIITILGQQNIDEWLSL